MNNQTEISIGVLAHNEEKNIEVLIKRLSQQELEKFVIKEIVVISSGSTDRTDQILQRIATKDPLIRFFTEDKRRGKYTAINLFIKHSMSNILVMVSADTLPLPQAIEEICLPLLTSDIGITGGKIIPKLHGKGILQKVASLQWKLHHQIASKHPKFGELIAFKKIFDAIPPTLVDEEEIANIIFSKGFQGAYAPNAKTNNLAPATIKDFIKQRSRIFHGHLLLKKQKGYKVPTLNHLRILLLLLQQTTWKSFSYDLCAIVLEGIARFIGAFIFFTQKKHNYIWSISSTTKKDLTNYNSSPPDLDF